MSANEFLPWVRRAAPEAQPELPPPHGTTQEPADSPRALQRRSFVQLLGVEAS